MSSPLHAAAGARENARRLRRDMTAAETLLWSKLRRGALAGHHFRRQVPLGPFIADFCCAKAFLVVEVDGGQHAESARDIERSAWLAQHGYRVRRFWNNEALRNIEGVVAIILEDLAVVTPPSPPSP